MSKKILNEYSYNVPKYETLYTNIHDRGGKNGNCPRDCEDCIAHKKQCQGCDWKTYLLCPDKKCSGNNCYRCSVMCARAYWAKRTPKMYVDKVFPDGRLKKAIDFIDGLDIDKRQSGDKKIIFPAKYIPAINKPLKAPIKYPIISIPFYAVFDFATEKLICNDIKDYFRIDNETKIIINFYFKDDKITKIFDYIMGGIFWHYLISLIGVDYFHTPCFSVFSESSNMDCIFNFKRQFWVGDEMRELGFNVIQEVLYTTRMPSVNANMDYALELIKKKDIKNISQCGQLSKDLSGMIREDKFIRGLPPDVNYLLTGLDNKQRYAYNRMNRNCYFSDYIGQYSHRENMEEYWYKINSDLTTERG